MPRFRKKPVVVEAMQWNGSPEAATPVIDWVLSGGGTARYHEATEEAWGSQRHFPAQPEVIVIDTLEGSMEASVGDWIIKGVAGEFYPCKPEIFEAIEPLWDITEEDVLAEGFPALNPDEFIDMWCESHGLNWRTQDEAMAYLVRRIEWEYLDA